MALADPLVVPPPDEHEGDVVIEAGATAACARQTVEQVARVLVELVELSEVGKPDPRNSP
jgi:hypothetical protein